MRRIPDRRVVLHIGAPLTGAAHLRETLRRNRRGLTRSGVLYPGSHLGDDAGHLHAVLDVLGLSAPDAPGVTGAWERLTQAAHDWRRGTVVVSHDLLADADEEQAHRIVSAFTPADVHVVYVARDLGRQLPLAWQEWVRNGGTATFASYVDRVARRAPHRLARVFWSSHDVQEVLGRWSTWVPPERVHVVTVPQGPDQDRTVWSRFALTLGIDPGKARTAVDGSRALQALAATEVQRLLNGHGGARLPDGLLAGLSGPVPAVPEEHRARVVEEAERAVEAVKAGGYDVVGDVTDLRPDPEAFARSDVQVAALPADVQRAQTHALASALAPTPPRRRRLLR